MNDAFVWQMKEKQSRLEPNVFRTCARDLNSGFWVTVNSYGAVLTTTFAILDESCNSTEHECNIPILFSHSRQSNQIPCRQNLQRTNGLNGSYHVIDEILVLGFQLG